MALGFLHRSLDTLAVWTEDFLRLRPEPCRLAPALPLACFEPLPPLPDSPPREGPWSAPSPRPQAPGDRMGLRAMPALQERRGTALLVPPWKIGSPDLVSGYTDLLRAAGYDVWLVSLPHHLERTVAGARSGEGFISLDLSRLRAVFEQVVLELRVCAALAARHGEVGLVGLSLGGLASAFAATGPERLDFAALVAPAHVGLVMAETGIGRRYRRLATLAGSIWPGRDELAAALSPFDPAPRPCTARRLFIASGTCDRIVPPAGPTGLARAWGVAPRLYPRGHISLLFLCSALRRDLLRFALAPERPAGFAPVAEQVAWPGDLLSAASVAHSSRARHPTRAESKGPPRYE
jgi:hypothetical protein